MSFGEKALSAAVMFAIGIWLLLTLNRPGGPTTQTTGIILSSAYMPSSVQAPTELAAVRLANGLAIQAHVLPNVVVPAGQTGSVRVYRRLLTGVEYYEIIAGESK